MTRMTGGQALVKSILAHDVDTIFALPGVQIDHLFNAMHDEGNKLRLIHSRHEQGAAYMANGYAQSTGRVGVYAVVPGPGLLNTYAALATAYGCNAPVLAVSGQIPSYAIGRGMGMLHEVPDQLAMTRGITKWAERIDHPAETPDRVAEAFKQLATGRPRPVELEMALDVMAQKAEVALLDPVRSYPVPEPDPELIERAAEMLAHADNPLIVVGGGVFGAEAELKELAEMLQAPVCAHRMGRGALDDRHYLAQTLPGSFRLWPEADVVLGIGSRMQNQLQSWDTTAKKIIRIDIDPVEIGRFGRPAVGIVADAKATLGALIPALARANRLRDSREDELTKLKAGLAAEWRTKFAPQMGYLEVLREALPEDGFLVDELTQVGYVGRAAFPVYRPRSYVGTGYQGTLGAGFATALGVKVANPDAPVLSINGDGGFMYNVQELSTAVQQGLDVVSVVFADGAFGNVQRMQRELHDGRVLGTDLKNPDFVALAESFGAAGFHAETPDELGSALGRAFEQKGPSVIEVEVGPMPDPWSTLIPRRPRA